MNKELFFGALAILLLATGCFIYEDYQTNDVDVLDTDNCNNFNGRSFLLTGGTGTPNNIDESNYEMARLNWLCGGGN